MSTTTPPQRSVQPEDWFAAYFIGVTALATVLAFNLTGDGLRDALDPKLKR